MSVWLPGYSLEEWEKIAIVQAMKYCQGNQTRAASLLKCAVRTIYAKLEKYAEEDKANEERRIAKTQSDGDWLQKSRGLSSPNAGMRVEPITQISPQQHVPVQEREEVQKVLPGPITEGSQHRRRRQV